MIEQQAVIGDSTIDPPVGRQQGVSHGAIGP